MQLSPEIAMVIDTVATFVTQFGYLLMKMSHQEAEKDKNKKIDTISGFLRWRWLSGFAFCCLGGIGHVGKFLFVRQSILIHF